MKREETGNLRRNLLKGMLVAGAAVLGAAGSAKAKPVQNHSTAHQGDEILYRESDEFKRYYKSLSEA